MVDDDYVEPGPFGHPILVAIGPKLPALLSLLGSYTIIREVITDLRQKNRSGRALVVRAASTSCEPLSRTLISLCVGDIASSVAWFLSTWMFPTDTPGEVWGNVGNVTTCRLQGFLLQFGITAAPLFNTIYAFLSLLLLRYRCADKDLVRLEPYFHAIIWTSSFGMAAFPIFLELYHPTIQVCWIDSLRSRQARIFAIVMSVIPNWLCIGIAGVILFLIWSTVRATEDRMARYSRRFFNEENISKTDDSKDEGAEESGMPSSNVDLAVQQTTSRERSESVKWQAIWYMTAFIGTYLLDLVVYALLGFNLWFEPLDWSAYFVYPMQGFFNFIVFCRPRRIMLTPEGRFFRRLVCCACRDTCNAETSPQRQESAPSDAS